MLLKIYVYLICIIYNKILVLVWKIVEMSELVFNVLFFEKYEL